MATVLKTVNDYRSGVRISLPPYKFIMKNIKLENFINKYLNNKKIKDKSINGLQIIGKNNIKKILFSVTLNLKLIKKAILNKYDSIIIHHGIMWNKNKINIYNIKNNNFKLIIKNKINIYTWHLPLDIHPKIGNNVLLAKKLNIKINIFPNNKKPYLIGQIKNCNLINKIKYKFKYFISYISKKKKIKKICLCTGNGSNFIEKNILKHNIDTYITGEITEHSLFLIKEYDINLFVIGHQQSEIYGIKKLCKLIKNKFNIKTKYINIKNSLFKLINKN